jgi:hypothetical protein
MQRVLIGCVGLLHNVSGCRRGLVFGVESVKLDVKCVSVVGCVLIVHWLKVFVMVFFFFFFFFLWYFWFSILCVLVPTSFCEFCVFWCFGVVILECGCVSSVYVMSYFLDRCAKLASGCRCFGVVFFFGW